MQLNARATSTAADQETNNLLSIPSRWRWLKMCPSYFGGMDGPTRGATCHTLKFWVLRVSHTQKLYCASRKSCLQSQATTNQGWFYMWCEDDRSLNPGTDPAVYSFGWFLEHHKPSDGYATQPKTYTKHLHPLTFRVKNYQTAYSSKVEEKT